MKSMEQCLRTDCTLVCAVDDFLFCSFHRRKWREATNLFGPDTPQPYLKMLLNNFANGKPLSYDGYNKKRRVR